MNINWFKDIKSYSPYALEGPLLTFIALRHFHYSLFYSFLTAIYCSAAYDNC